MMELFHRWLFLQEVVLYTAQKMKFSIKTLKLNSNAYKKYEYGSLGSWYIKLTLFKKF